MRRLYMHVGTHKTGTTSLQAYLLDNAPALDAHNNLVIKERHNKFGEVANCFGFAHAVLRSSLMTVARITGDMPPSRLKSYLYRRHLRNRLARLSEDRKAILSAEALCFARTGEELRRLQDVFAGLDLEVVPVICTRNEGDWRESWNSELQAWSDRMVGQFGEGTDDIRGDWYFDRERIFKFWEAFGTVRHVDYDAAVNESRSVLPALLQALDVPEVGNLDQYMLRRRQKP